LFFLLPSSLLLVPPSATMRAFTTVFSLLVSAAIVSAEEIWIQVGGNTSTNASLVFQPQTVQAKLNDTVYFNFTQGNHTAIQSTFAQPCLPSDESINPYNGFTSGFRLAGNGSNVSYIAVPMLEENYNLTFWFYDYNTCGEGGVGVINPNTTAGANETLEGFERNAVRLNGTATSSSASPSATSPSGSGSSTSPSPSTSNTPSSGERNAVLGGLAALPLVLAAFALQ